MSQATAQKCQELFLKILSLCSDLEAKEPMSGKVAIGFGPDGSFSTLTVFHNDTHFHLAGENFTALIDKLHKIIVVEDRCAVRDEE